MRIRHLKNTFSISILFCICLTSCEPNENIENCSYEAQCRSTSFVIVDSKAIENLIGENLLIHPDSIVILNDRLDTMYHEIRTSFGNYNYISRFNPFQEITCFNQCLSDSAFSRYYYLYVGNGDMDTIEVHFPAKQCCATVYEFYFNGETGQVPEDILGTDIAIAPFMFRKKVD